jgi:hypothetical protein
MNIQIFNHLDLVIFECDAESVKEAVEIAIRSRVSLYGANLSYTNLCNINLYGGNLSCVNFSCANLSYANFSYANLSYVNLSYASLYGANFSCVDVSCTNLCGASLYGAILYGEEIKKAPVQILGLKWPICITEKHIQIGYQIHDAAKWFAFTDQQISAMCKDTLPWWKTHKKMIIDLWEQHTKATELIY